MGAALLKAFASVLLALAPVSAAALQLNAPANLSAVAVGPGEIDLSWQDTNSSETDNFVERSLSQSSGFVQIAALARNVTSYQDLDVVEGTTYFYRVFAAKNGTPSPYSNTASTTTPQTIPIAPGSLTAVVVSFARVDLTWTDNSFNESGFRIDRSLSSTGPWVSAGSVSSSGTSFSDQGVSENTTYFYRVAAFNTAGEADSNLATASTPQSIPLAPDGLSAAPVSASQINLSWNDHSFNETVFKIERGSSSSGP